MKHIFTVIVLLAFINEISCQRNNCCSDKRPIVNKTCSNGEKPWTINCLQGAYFIQEGYFFPSEDDTISTNFTKVVKIPRERYCLGQMNDLKVALICFKPETITGNPFFPLLICCLISVICLALTISVYFLVPKLRDLQGKCIMITMVNLMIAYVILFLIQIYNKYSYTSCLLIGSSMYLFFLLAFFWMNIVAINIWYTTAAPKIPINKNNLFLYYNIYGWSCPIIFLIAAHIAHHVPGDHLKPGWTEYSCWFKGFAQIIYFHIPILILMTANLVLFILSGWSLWKQGKYNIGGGQSTEVRLYQSRKYKCILYLKIFLIMGISWIFEPISTILYQNGQYIWIVTDYINALQGVIIFLLLVILRKRVRRELARRNNFCCNLLPKTWARIPDEECEELEDDFDDNGQEDETNVNTNQIERY